MLRLGWQDEGDGGIWVAKRRRISPQQRERMRKLRCASTFPERLLWSRLRAGRLAGLKFRRQHAIGPYVVDFFCSGASLVVELDGLSHVGRVAYDTARAIFLKSKGFHVIRYSNDQVLQDLDCVVEDIGRHTRAVP